MALLKIHALHVRLEGQSVLQDIELTLEPGEVLGLLGANGSGKSTLLRCIAGLMDARSGGVWIDVVAWPPILCLPGSEWVIRSTRRHFPPDLPGGNVWNYSPRRAD